MPYIPSGFIHHKAGQERVLGKHFEILIDQPVHLVEKRRIGMQNILHLRDKRPDQRTEHRLEYLVLGPEIIMQCRPVDTGRHRNIAHAGILIAFLDEHPAGGDDDFLFRIFRTIHLDSRQ